MTPEQIKYVTDELARGVDLSTIKETLLSNGYSEEQAKQLIAQVSVPQNTGTTEIPAPATQPVKKKMSLLLIIVLAVLGTIVVIVVGLGIIVGASLDGARTAGMDASIKQTLSSSRTQAELYYSNNNFSYAGFCESDSLGLLVGRLENDFECLDAPTGYRVSAKLNEEGYFCVMVNPDDENSISETREVLVKPTGFGC